MLKLLGRSTSINVRKVLWTCAELDLPLDHEEWGAPALDLHSPSFLALNPNGLVPVLRDGDLVLYESNAICRYLADREGRRDLLPAVPAERAVVDQWMDWQATELNGAWRYAFLSLVRRSSEHRDAGLVAASIAAWHRHMRILDARLAATGGYIAGPTFTLADIVVGLAAYRWTMTPIERPVLAAVDVWMDRLATRPAYRLHVANGIP